VDPDAVYYEMFCAMRDSNHEEARFRALDLRDWLRGGGFYPSRHTKVEVDSYLASVLRRTAHVEVKR
jgi:hypothetical protein